MESAVYAGIAGLAVDGIDGWRLPTVEELDYVCGNAEPVNRKLKEYGKEIFNIDTYGIYSYYCLDEGMVKVYTPYRKSFNENPNTGLRILIPAWQRWCFAALLRLNLQNRKKEGAP